VYSSIGPEEDSVQSSFPGGRGKNSRAAQDHPQRLRERSRSARTRPSPPTEALSAAQDRPQRPKSGPRQHTDPVNFTSGHQSEKQKKEYKEKYAARQLHDGPTDESKMYVEGTMYRQNKLPVNIAHKDQTTVSLNSVAVKQQAIDSTTYKSTRTMQDEKAKACRQFH
jgi:hypothetical protein